ncbi:helix-turn-helix domain-containing protein [Rhodoferax antarcticus]|uniref:helix-turn-helix domain-containing protein n=1 Tax=Rhodoferax antarcticus TaxID=81479 RepID=UPI002224C5C1|nr:helix-turn-helix transcriptional regulator [Rhodoferax antarcticus]MCW2314202.1 transcriptional regulator with XRE-family HTH domain [Rhodoferax antarcticus]
MDFSLALPDEICAELGARTRARRVQLNFSVEEMAQRIGVSYQTLSHFERHGKCSLSTFVRTLEALNATPDLQSVLVQQAQTIEDMRVKSAGSQRQRAYRKSRSSQ